MNDEHPYRKRVFRGLKWLALGLAGLMAGLVVFVMLFDFSGYLQSTLSKKSGREVELAGKLDIDWGWNTRIHLRDVRIGNMEDGSAPQMLTLAKADITVSVKDLLTGNVVLPEVVIEKPDILLEKDKDGNSNWKFGSNPEAKALTAPIPESRGEVPAIGRLIIHDGRLRYKDAASGADIDAKITTIRGSADADEMISVEGKGQYKKKPFSLKFTGGSVLALQDTDKPYPLTADIEIADTTAVLKGEMQDPLQMKGMNINLRVKGVNAADIFPILGIALPPTPPYDVSGQLEREGEIWRFNDFKGHLGDSDLSGSLAWDQSKERPKLTAIFTSKRLDLNDLSGLIGSTPDARKIEDPEQKQQKARQEASPFVIPDTSLDITKLSAMDAEVEFTGKEVISSSLPLDDFYLKLNLDNKLMKLEPLKFGTAKGDITANMTVNARVTPVKISGDFKFYRLQLAQLFGTSPGGLSTVPAKGYIGGTAKLEGTGTSLRQMLSTSNGTIGVGMEGGQLSNLLVELMGLDVAESLGFMLSKDKPVRVRCVIGDFAVKNGRMHSNALVVDTSDTNVTGNGTINFHDEKMDITMRAHPKDGSILSLRSPLHVGGTLKDPSIGIQPAGLIAKGGVGVALGAVLLPLGIITFIEPGLGKDSDCAKMIYEMNRKTGKNTQTDLVPENPKSY